MKAVQFMALTVLQAYKIRELYQQYSLNGHSDEVSIEDLKDVISDYTQTKITIKEVDWGSHRFRGMIQRFDGHATIYIAARGNKGDEGKLTYCEQRFVIAKEMGHLVVDSDENYTLHAASLVEELCNPVVAELDAKHQLQSEHFTKIFAIETLIPYHRRLPHLERIRMGEDTVFEVASHFRVPEKEVQTALSPEYEAACEHLYKLLD